LLHFSQRGIAGAAVSISRAEMEMSEIVVEKQERTGVTKRRKWLVPFGVVAVVTVVLLFGSWKWRETRLERHALAEVKEDLGKGLYGLAARKLEEVLDRNPESHEGNYLLGICEKARGRPDTAIKAWALVPPDSPFAPRAIQARVELEIERGRLAKAEQIVLLAREDRRIEGSGLGLFLGSIYGMQGRIDEAERFVEDRWNHLNRVGQGASMQAIHLARLSNQLREREIPADEIRSFIDHAANLAPQDDRVWLARANLAIRVGAYDEAKHWLDACQKLRPDDVPVWRARLRWAVAFDRVAMAQSALEHIPASATTDADVQRLAAWLSARKGNMEQEMQSLERLVVADPGDSVACERLAQLADQAGETLRAGELRRRRAEIDRTKARYQKLFERDQPLRDAVEMARLAEQLGRWFEANVFLAVAILVEGNRSDLMRDLERIRQQRLKTGRDNRTLAEVLATELVAIRSPRVRAELDGREPKVIVNFANTTDN
jgi:tetratricopeptide (TPR) repeat protein